MRKYGCGCCNCRFNRSRGGDKAHQLVAKAKSFGELPHLGGTIMCSYCNESATGYHHEDYNKPLDVLPVCRSHNIQLGQAKLVTSIPEMPCLCKTTEFRCLRCG